MESKDDKPAVQPQLDPGTFHLAEHQREVYTFTAENDHTRKQMLDPTYWSHVAARLRPYTEIIARRHDGTLYARFLVLASERTWARVFVLEWQDLTTRDVSLSQADAKAQQAPPGAPDSKYEVKHCGPHFLWCVVQKDTKPPVYLFKNMTEKIHAITALEEHLRVTA